MACKDVKHPFDILLAHTNHSRGRGDALYSLQPAGKKPDRSLDLKSWCISKGSPIFSHIYLFLQCRLKYAVSRCWQAVILPRNLALFTCLKHHITVTPAQSGLIFFFFSFGIKPDGDTGRQDSPLRITRHRVITLSLQVDMLSSLCFSCCHRCLSLKLGFQFPQSSQRFLLLTRNINLSYRHLPSW